MKTYKFTKTSRDLRVLSALFLIIIMGFSSLIPVAFAAPKKSAKEEMRGIWVASVLNLDYPKERTPDAEKLKKQAIEILNNADQMGFNAVFLQVRPTGDAFYKSKLANWSYYLTGKHGLAPTGGFDPLKFWIDEAHKMGIELHAWLNPYRLTMTKEQRKEFDIPRPDWTVEHTDGKLYLNPGIPGVVDHLVDVVMEIVNNYDIDGIHFDDYFYPGPAFPDQDTYKKYAAAGMSIEDWRRENVNNLIKNLDLSIKAVKPEIQFGISPFAIWANDNTRSEGSKTRGNQSLTSHFADTKKWVEEGWIDYIVPQIYWHIGFNIADYEILANWWSDVVDKTDVKLYVGMAGYRVGTGKAGSPWASSMQIEKQLNLNKTIPNISGAVHFRYESYRDKPGLRESISNYHGIYRGISDNIELHVGRPNRDVRTSSAKYFVGGVSDPSKKLYLNGSLVEDRSGRFFGKYHNLKMGRNVFTFKQEDGKTYTRVVTRVSAWSQQKMGSVISTKSVFPSVWTSFSSGENFNLRCVAPAGGKVTAVLNGNSYVLEQSKQTDGYPAVYSKTINLVPTGNPRIVDYGAVTYHLEHGGKKYSVKSPNTIRIIMKDAPYIGVTKYGDIDSYEDNSRNKGGHFLMLDETYDYITAEDAELVRLRSGQWVRRSHLDISYQKLIYNFCKSVEHRSDVEGEKLIFNTNYRSPVYAVNTGENIEFTVSSATMYPKTFVNLQGEFLEEVKHEQRGDDLVFIIKLKDHSRLGGYYWREHKDGTELVIRRKKKITGVYRPLDGIRIMIDPGHGGRDRGGISLFGPSYSENLIVMNQAQRLRDKLETLGADVIMTRYSNQRVGLYERLRVSKKYMPDLFISVHCDSMGETSDLMRIKGFSAFYKDPLAKPIADLINKMVVGDTEFTTRGVKWANFYVVRGTWTPSFLVEGGFMSNPNDMNIITDFNKSDVYLRGIVQQIVAYFRN